MLVAAHSVVSNGTPWNVNTGYYSSKSLSVAPQEGNPTGVAFSSDGTKAYVLGSTNDTIYQYTLSVAWDISTGSYASKSLSVAGQDTIPRGLAFSSDGARAYITGEANDMIFQYDLATPWDISTGSYASKSLYVGGQDGFPRGLTFSSDGVYVYVTGAVSDAIFQYNLT